MAAIDVSADIDIAAAPADIAGVMFDPAREPEWVKAVATVEIVDPALERGARVRRTGSLLGQTFGWTTEVDAVQFPHLLALRIVDGPIRGLLRYDIQRTATGSRVRIRSTGESPMLAAIPPAMVEGPLRSALAADLARLKAIVEQR